MDRMTDTAPTNRPGPQVPEWTLADRLIKARHHAELEQGELAEAIGIARSSLSSYENGHRTPRRPVLLSWAIACGVDVGWLTDGEATPRIHGPQSSVQPSLFELAA